MSLHPTLLLTGATGLVGSHALLQLVQKEITVRAFVRPGSNYRARLTEIFSWYSAPAKLIDQYIEFVEGNLLDIGSLEDALHGIETVIHAAACVREGIESIDMLEKVNVEGTGNLVNVCMEMNIHWFLHVSSVATLGPNPEGLVDEDFFFKFNPRLSRYALSKYAAEQEVWRAVEEGLKAVVINPSFILGPSESESSSSSIFFAAASGIPFYADGSGGYVDVRDVAEIIHRLYALRTSGKRYIVSAENIGTKVFLTQIATAMHSKPPSQPVREWMILPALFFFGIRTFFTGKKAPFSRSVIRMAQSRNAYDNSRIKECTGVQFRPVQTAIDETAVHMRRIISKQ